MVTETIPEIALISCGGGSYSKCYAYDTAQAGDLYTRTAPWEGHTSGTVVTTYAFDQMHRLTQVSYNDSFTPTISYKYDQTAAPSGWPSTTRDWRSRGCNFGLSYLLSRQILPLTEGAVETW